MKDGEKGRRFSQIMAGFVADEAMEIIKNGGSKDKLKELPTITLPEYLTDAIVNVATAIMGKCAKCEKVSDCDEAYAGIEASTSAVLHGVLTLGLVSHLEEDRLPIGGSIRVISGHGIEELINAIRKEIDSLDTDDEGGGDTLCH